MRSTQCKYARHQHGGFFLGTCLLLSLALLPGCGSTMLLEKEFVKTIAAPTGAESHVVYCTDDVIVAADGKVFEKKYLVVRVGTNASGYPRFLTEEENASRKVVDIEGRIIHTDGSHTRIPASAFYRANLSDEHVIAEQYARVAAIRDNLQVGDLVELVSLVEHTLPQLGILFSPAGLGYPSDNVTSSIETAPGQDVQYQVLNATVVPAIQRTPLGGKKCTFTWAPYRPPAKGAYPMAQHNSWPLLLAAPAPQSWVSFGDWYLGLIADKLLAGRALADTTARITAGKGTSREKMDAIFEYCQRAIRYEQMYFENGEFIPNAADQIFARHFGDCKDYATLMHAMAASAGIPTELVLCYRGRGSKVFEEIPASQFNHAILHYNDNGRDCWYDATDRIGLPGTPSFDLANARALIIEKGRSRFATIEECPENLLAITGNLGVTTAGGLRGKLAVTFSRQYAVEFSWDQEHLNSEKMRLSLTRKLKERLNDDLLIDSLTWNATREAFTVAALCDIPNCLTTLGEKTYVAPSRIFPNLLPDDVTEAGVQKAFYLPYVNRLAIDLTVTTAAAPLQVKLHYQLPAGPFDDTTRPAFLAQLAKVHAEFTRPLTFKGTHNP